MGPRAGGPSRAAPVTAPAREQDPGRQSAATGATQPPKTRSSSSATAIATWSRSRPAATWTPSGSPLWSQAQRHLGNRDASQVEHRGGREQPRPPDRASVARRHAVDGRMEQYPVADRVDQLGGERSAALDQPPSARLAIGGSISVASVMRVAACAGPPRTSRLRSRQACAPASASSSSVVCPARRLQRGEKRQHRAAPRARARHVELGAGARRAPRPRARARRAARELIGGTEASSTVVTRSPSSDTRPDRRARPRDIAGPRDPARRSPAAPASGPRARRASGPVLKHRRGLARASAGTCRSLGTTPGGRLVAEHAAEQCRDPDRAARCRTPTPNGEPPQPTAAPSPPEEPPAIRRGSYGLDVRP